MQTSQSNSTKIYSDTGFDIQIISNHQDFSPLIDEWNDALATYPLSSVHLSADYIDAMWRHFPDIRGQLIIIRKNGVIQALAPLAQIPYNYRGLSLSSIAPLDYMRSGRSDIPILANRESLTPILLKTVQSLGGDLWHLDRVPSQSPAFKILAKSPPQKIETYAHYDLAIIDTNQSWESYLASKSKNFRKNYRRIETASHALQKQFITTESDQWPGFIENVTSIMKGTWKSKKGQSFGDDERRIGFYNDLIETFGKRNQFAGAMLFDDQKPVGFTFGFVHANTLYAMETSYLDDYAHTCAGIMSYAMVIKHAFDTNAIDACDMDTIRDHGEYKKRWATHYLKQSSALYLNGGIGSFVIWAGRALARLKNRGH